MLPILAMLVAGYLAKQSGGGEGGGLGGLIGGMLGGGGQANGGGGLGGMLGNVLGGALTVGKHDVNGCFPLWEGVKRWIERRPTQIERASRTESTLRRRPLGRCALMRSDGELS